MIDKERINRLLDALVGRSERWAKDAEERNDWNDVSDYEGQKKMAEEIKDIISRW